jgi:hypothetical protein
MELILDISIKSIKSIKSLFCKDDIYYLIYPSITHNVLRVGSRYISNIITDIDDFEYTYEAHILRKDETESCIKIFKKKTFRKIKISKSYLYKYDGSSSCFHIFPKKADIPDLGFVGTAINTNVKADIVRYNDERYHTIGSIINDNEIKIVKGKYIDDDNDLCISTYVDNFPKDDNVECVNCYGNIYDKEGYLILTYRFYSADILQINGVSIKVAILGYDETEFKNTVRKPTYAILSCKNNNLLQIDVY